MRRMEPGPLIRPKASAMQPGMWRWREIEPLVRRSPEFLAPGHGAERRILRLDNAGVPERTAGHTISQGAAHRRAPDAGTSLAQGLLTAQSRTLLQLAGVTFSLNS